LKRRITLLLAGVVCLTAVIGIVAQGQDQAPASRLTEIATELEQLRDSSSLSPEAVALLTKAIQSLKSAVGQTQEAQDYATQAAAQGVTPTEVKAAAVAEATAAAAVAPLYSSAIATEILGTCTAAVHDRYVLDGGDGYRYRTWHPQTVPVNAADPAGAKCTFGHEHGDDPAKQTLAKIKAIPVVFGYVGRRMPSAAEPNGHDEPHEGFKVFVANKGQRNNEGRTNLHDSRFILHMGTGGPKRFSTRMHTIEYAVQTSYGAWMNIKVMGDSGGVGNICANPRQGKTVMSLAAGCKVDSLYEIWEVKGSITNSRGYLVGRATASAAVFDPITVYDPANPTRLLYTWDTAVNAILNWPGNNRSYVRGCDREAYHGPTWWDNTISGAKTVYVTDSMGKETTPGPLTINQEISLYRQATNFIATNDGLSQFKLQGKFCGAGLSYKN
jgi:hypothetical protein